MADTEARIDVPESKETTGKPFGPVAAAFLASGIGAVVLGILTTLAEASEGWATRLEFNSRVGALSGKTIVALIAYFVSWALLHVTLKDKRPDVTKVFMWTGILVVIGLILTFPTFFQMFASEG
jgi:cytosine/uracil/thiamine/allantoin permease